MDTINATNVAKKAGHAAIGVLKPIEARIFAENLAMTFPEKTVSVEGFVRVFMDIYAGPGQYDCA